MKNIRAKCKNERLNEQIFSPLCYYNNSYIPENYGLIMNEIDPIKFKKIMI